MSSSLIKLIDTSILPAALLILSKVLGLYLVITFFDLEWQMNFVSGSISVYPVVFQKDLLVASSYSDLIVLVVMMGGYIWTAIKSSYFHDTHIHPTLIVKLANVNMLGLAKDSFRIYFDAAIWFLFSLIAEILVLINYFRGITFLWIVILGGIALIVISIFILRDIEMEIDRRKSNLKF